MLINKVLKTSTFFIVFFIFCSNTGAQNSSKEIDSVSRLLEKNYITGDNNPGLTLKNAIVLYYLSREKKFYPGQVYSIFEEVRIYQLNGDFDAALAKINEGVDLAIKQNDYNMICRILLSYHKVLLQLDHLSAAKQILNKCQEYNKLVTIKNDKLVNDIHITVAKAELLTISENFNESTKQEVVRLKKLAYSQCLKIGNESRLKKVTTICTLESLAGSLARFKKVDEARKYIAITDQFLASFPDDRFIIQNLINKGIVEKESGNYPAAISYFSRAIMDSQKDHNRYEQYEVYAMMAESYEGLKDYEQSTYFSKKYKRIIDSVDLVKKKSGDVNFINKINGKVSDNVEEVSSKPINIAIGAGVILLAALFGFLYYKKKQGNKEDNSIQNKIPDEVPADIINLEKAETETVKDNISNAKSENTKELILLAKEDINAFYIEFQKIYPNFYPTLKSKYPDLNISDINFCTLLKMNFGIKEISQYANSTIRAAEARRYRINKKMELKNQNELYMVLSSIN
ncbi:tetratricopeptide repeat protein [Chryseobacterium daecheongense]|nr:tetratricopeptide repeat protein [Chryseobacterium daecheongense]